MCKYRKIQASADTNVSGIQAIFSENIMDENAGSQQSMLYTILWHIDARDGALKGHFERQSPGS